MGAIERGVPVGGIRGGSVVVGSVGGVEEGVNLDHVGADVGGPLEDLRPNVG